MNNQHILHSFGLILLGTSLFVACAKHEQGSTVGDSTKVATAAPAKSGVGLGVVRAIDTSAKKVTLDHGNIPGIMDAMAMSYPVARTEILQGIHVGDSVSFTLETRSEGIVVTTVATIPKK
jgi:Cu(I)/Ag(I) efflux system protein CusF